MGSELLNSIAISANGMRAQGTRIRVISENIANADTAATTPGAILTSARSSALKTRWIASWASRR